MTVDTRDILIKAAEDVTSGMHCKGNYFDNEVTAPGMLLREDHHLEGALRARRCAMGSIALSTALLGGTYDDYLGAIETVASAIDGVDSDAVGIIAHFNDNQLPDDPFEAGQQLAELFRQTAESL